MMPLKLAFRPVSAKLLLRSRRSAAVGLSLQKTCWKAAYSFRDYEIAMQREQRYICGGNFFWQSMMQSPIPGVPLSWRRLQELVKSQYEKPRPYQPGMLVLQASRTTDPMGMKGALLRLSPEELSHAFLVAIHRDIENQVPEDTLLEWVKYARSCCVQFVEPTGTEAVYWEAFNLREIIVASNALVQRTVLQRAMEVEQYRVMKSKEAPQTNESIASAYSSRGKLGAPTEKLDGSAVQALRTIYEKFCKVPKLMSLLLELENMYGLQSCLNSASKLVKLAEKAESLEMRIFCVEFLVDQIKAGNITNSSVTRDWLTGQSGSGSKVPFVQLCQFRNRIKGFLLNSELPRHKFPAVDLQQIGEALKDVSSFRSKVEALDGVAETQWMGRMRPSAIMALKLLQDWPSKHTFTFQV